MRIVRGGAPGSSLGEMWGAIRDHGIVNAKPADVEARAESRKLAPPSRAMLKRQARAKAQAEIGQARADVARTLTPSYEFFRAQLRQIPASPISTASDEGLEHAQSNWQALRDFRRYSQGG